MKLHICTALDEAVEPSKVGHTWFDNMSEHDQQAYLKLHPHSKMAHHAKRLVKHAGLTAKSLAKDQHEFFHGDGHVAGSEPRRKLGQLLKDKMKGAIKAVKHEAREFKYAGHAMADLARGKTIDKHQKAAIKTVMIHSLLVIGPAAVSGGLSAGLTSVLPHLAGGFLEHTLVTAAAKAMVFASTAAADDEPTSSELLGKLLTGFADYIAKGKISETEWQAAFDASKANLENSSNTKAIK